MKVNYRKLLLFLLITILLYQDSLIDLIHINILSYIDETFVLIIFIMGLVYSHGKIPKMVIKILGLVLIFSFIGIISYYTNSSMYSNHLVAANFLAIKFFLLLSGIIMISPKLETIEYCLSSIKIQGCLSLVAGFINFIIPSVWEKLVPYTYIYKRMGLPSVMGFFDHSGKYGWFMMFVAIIYYAYYKSTKEKRYIWLFMLYAFTALLSFKVKVIVTLIMIIFADNFLINLRSININGLIILLVTTILVFSLFGDLIRNTYVMYFTSNINGTSARYSLLSGSEQLMKIYFPLGVGFGKFASWYARLDYSEYYYQLGLTNVYGLTPQNPFFATDTFWPILFGETGFIGTIVYTILLIYLFFILRLKVISMRTSEVIISKVIVLSGFLIFIQALVESSGEAIFNSAPQNLFIAVACGFALGINSEVKKYKKG